MHSINISTLKASLGMKTWVVSIWTKIQKLPGMHQLGPVGTKMWNMNQMTSKHNICPIFYGSRVLIIGERLEIR